MDITSLKELKLGLLAKRLDELIGVAKRNNDEKTLKVLEKVRELEREIIRLIEITRGSS